MKRITPAAWNVRRLAREYRFRDVGGRQPRWGEYFAAHVQQPTPLEWLQTEPGAGHGGRE